ncbi:hypothetical protein SAMN04487895_1272 [Paenibacillus sophorae]|uniref:Uncharacterized protein n=1 Tax=Paenibacillus sophorae TaxID=1333845 RepID=A0A1H8VRD6_9BACL|nr:hypothetical protein [Paenibacillus sophorae]SEP17787.1 hypothetical protein SAMN04487895_1272 [Paenibacillus sophorae]
MIKQSYIEASERLLEHARRVTYHAHKINKLQAQRSDYLSGRIEQQPSETRHARLHQYKVAVSLRLSEIKFSREDQLCKSNP